MVKTLFLFSFTTLLLVGTNSATSMNAVHTRRQHAGTASACRNGINFKLSGYKPSAWEQSWSVALAKNKEEGCAFVKANEGRVSAWLENLKDINNLELRLPFDYISDVPQRNETALSRLSTDIFSEFIFENQCPGELYGLKKRVLLEPLVGHMRHPRSLTQCTSVPEVEYLLESMSHILVNPFPSRDFQLLYPGKRYLLDCGASSFRTSLMYFLTRYRQSGIDFDEVWAWEAKETSPKDYWDGVPNIYKKRLHYYNTPITSDVSNAAHPLSIIRSIYRPGDFISLKLDIDNVPLELAIVDAIENDSELIEAIGEMFYEQHYDHAEMEFVWGSSDKEAPGVVQNTHFDASKSVRLKDAYETFSRLRNMGLILHYWP